MLSVALTCVEWCWNDITVTDTPSDHLLTEFQSSGGNRYEKMTAQKGQGWDGGSTGESDWGLFKLRELWKSGWAPNSLGWELGRVQDFLKAGPASWQCDLCRHAKLHF